MKCLKYCLFLYKKMYKEEKHVQLSLSRPYYVLFLRQAWSIRQHRATRSSFLSS